MLEPTDPREWFVSQGNTLEGPFTAARIRDLIRWGKISEHAYLCDEYNSAWIPIRQSALAGALAEVLPPDTREPDGEPASDFEPVRRLLIAAALALAALIGVLAE